MGYPGKYKKVKGVWGKGHGQDCAGQPEMQDPFSMNRVDFSLCIALSSLVSTTALMLITLY